MMQSIEEVEHRETMAKQERPLMTILEDDDESRADRTSYNPGRVKEESKDHMNEAQSLLDKIATLNN